jgi:hypothetical protein
MGVRPASGDDAVMLALRSPDPRQALLTSAHELQLVAGALERDAGSARAVPSLPVAVAHVEETLDRLAIAMERMAHAVADWSGERRETDDEDALPPDARALCWHLRTTAHTLRSSRDACSASREWAERLLDGRLDTSDDGSLPVAARDDL